MHTLRRIVKTVLFSVAFSGVAVLSASADNIPLAPTPAPVSIAPVVKPPMASENFSRAPDGFDISKSSSAIADALADGGRAFYIGNHGGLDGWLLVKGTEIQVVYTTADRKTLMVGLLFGADGYNITSDQVEELIRTNREAASEMSIMMRQQLGVGSGEIPVMSMTPPSSKFGLQSTEPAMAVPDSTALNAAKQMETTMPPGERLLLDLQNAAGVDIGDSQAPVLYMVMNPDCPHCQATWRELRDAIFKKSIRIHVVPMGKSDSDENEAAQLLHVANPLTAWDKYVGGDKSQLAGVADPKFIQNVKANHVLADRWSISEMPYMVYRSKTGEIRVLAGQPDHVDTLLNDVGP